MELMESSRYSAELYTGNKIENLGGLETIALFIAAFFDFDYTRSGLLEKYKRLYSG